MQIHGPDRVELTVLFDRPDYRRLHRDAGQGRSLVGLIFIPIPLLAFVSLAAEQYLGALGISLAFLFLVVAGRLTASRAIAKLPDWAFGPTTFRFTAEGIETQRPMMSGSVSWPAISGYTKSSVAYWFLVPGSHGIGVPRRTLTAQDEVALEAFVAQHVPPRKGGEPPAAQLPPAPAPQEPPAVVRSAAPGA
ncbi:MAG: YcxB family protein [Hamadaea sp.]|nr:YcxB family protein [Hamadaea sp.]